MSDFSKATDVKNFFDGFLQELGNAKITGIFTVCPIWSSFNLDHNEYMQDTPVFVMFDNGKCLVVDYRYINELKLEYREMTENEYASYEHADIKDCFNRVNNIHDGHTHKVKYIDKSSLDYGKIIKIELNSVTKPYSAWVNGGIEYDIIPTEETFDEIKFYMDNGKSFYFCAIDAEADGYTLLWSNDADETQEPV